MKIVAWDLETTDLKALMGQTLCCSFSPVNKIESTYSLRGDIKPFREKDPISDRKLVVAIRDELERYHCIVGWNSKLFDLAFLNARLLHFGERPCRPQFHIDLMYYARGASLKIGSSKLENVQKFFRLPDEKTPLEWDEWKRAARADKKAMDKVLKHCEQDTKCTAQAYWVLLPMIANIHR